MQRSKYVKRIIKAILFASLFVVFTAFFDMAFEFDERNTEEMLTAFSEQSGLNTVFVGTSVGEMMDAKEYEKITGEHAFNMCTPSQSLSVSLKNIRLAASNHRIRKAILLTSVETVNLGQYNEIDHIYDRVVDSSSPLHVRIKNAIGRNIRKTFSKEYINREQSINIWIPWENEAVYDKDSIINNLKTRFGRLIRLEPIGYKIAYDLNTVKYAVRSGDPGDEDNRLLEEDLSAAMQLNVPQDMVSEDKLVQLSEICTFCRNNGIELIVLTTPHRSDYYSRNEDLYGNERTVSAYLKDFFAKRGVAYTDTEDDSAVHQIIPDEEFYDYEHVRDEFVSRSSEYLTGQLMEAAAGRKK